MVLNLFDTEAPLAGGILGKRPRSPEKLGRRGLGKKGNRWGTIQIGEHGHEAPANGGDTSKKTSERE